MSKNVVSTCDISLNNENWKFQKYLMHGIQHLFPMEIIGKKIHYLLYM